MARPRKPSNVLHLNGAFKHDPARGEARANEPVAIGDIGEPPAHLDDAVRACWVEIVGLCHPGVLCTADRLVMEHTSQLLAQLRASSWQVHPTILIRFEASLGKLGMTPADRSKVSAAKPKEAYDPLDEFTAAS